MLEQFPPNFTIPLTEEIIEQLRNEREQFNIQSTRCLKQFDTSNDIQYFIISTRFLKQWENMVSEATQSTVHSDSKKQIKTPSLMNQQLISEHLKDFNEYVLKKQVQEGLDYKLFNYSVLKIFSNYAASLIVRKAYYYGAQKKVQLYPIKFSFIFMSRSWVNLINQDRDIELPLLSSLGYKNQTILDLLYRLVQFSKKDQRNKSKDYINNAAARVYYAPNFDPKQYAKTLLFQKNEQKQKESSTEIQNVDKQKKQDTQMTQLPPKVDKVFLEPPGDQISSNKMIGDIEIPSSANFVLIVELQEQKWLYKSAFDAQKQRCQFCRQLKKLKFACRCKDVKYCTIQCKQKDWKYHIKSCQAQYQEDNTQPKFQVKQKSKLGLVGLSNLGNTCYMNAALQCLIHTKDLTEYFREKLYLDQINQKNPIGSKGKLIKSYAKFIQSTIVTEQDVVVPSRLKYTIGKSKQMFSGFEQHDSQQFLLFLLDTLHEDLNRVLDKPYTTGVQNEGRPDQIVAKESWITYLKRNQSFINDLMGGQYRSQVKCPDCESISVTFDPYLIFAVPIPTCQAKQINLYYFYSNFNSETLKITLTSKNNLVKQLIEDLAAKTKTEAKQILLIVSGFNGTVRKVQNTQTVDRLINQKQLNENSQQKQLFAMQYEPQQLQNLENKKFLIFKFIIKEGRTLAFKRPFPLECNNLKGGQLYDRICEFTLNLWSKAQKLSEKQKQTKLNIFKTMVQQQKFFRINLCYGTPTQVKNKLIYDSDKKIQIDYEANISELLAKYNDQVQFEVQYKQDPHHSFNSYKSHGDSSYSSYDQGPKLGSNQSYTLQQCLNQMKKSQKLVQGNEVFCSKCQDLKLAEKKMQLYKASKYLVLQLRRFKQIGYEKSKNYAEINFPIELDLTDHIISPGNPENYFIGQQQFFIKPKYWKGYDESKQTKYRLYGVVNHHGSLNGGHYTAFGIHQNKWYKFDDRDVSPVDSDKIVTNAAYLLFYERI